MRGILHAEDFGWAVAPRFGGGGGGGNTTTTQKSEPWSGQQPYLSGNAADGSADGSVFGTSAIGTPLNGTPGVFPEAARLYTTAIPSYYPGQTYQPMVPGQAAAYQYMWDFGHTGGQATPAALHANEAVVSPDYTAASRGTYNAVNPTIAALGSGALIAPTAPAFMSGQNYLSNMIGGSGVAPTLPAALQNQGLLSNEIGGAYLDPSTNPGFQNVVNTTLAKTMPAITAPFVGAGRSDSGLASRALGEGVTDAIGGLTLQNYLTERQNQNAAGQQAASNLLAEQGLQQGAAQQAAQNLSSMIGGTQTAQALAANTLLGQQGQQIQAQGLAPMIDQTILSNLNTAAQASGQTQQDMQNQINAAIQAWNYNQMLPWNQLGLYNSMVQGNYGGTTTTTQPYYSNTGANVAAGVGAAASVATAIAAII